jgi:hypothetical protein
MGVINPAASCFVGEFEGFLAFLEGPDGEIYRYHGGNGTFIAVDFEEGISGHYDPISR